MFFFFVFLVPEHFSAYVIKKRNVIVSFLPKIAERKRRAINIPRIYFFFSRAVNASHSINFSSPLRKVRYIRYAGVKMIVINLLAAAIIAMDQ